MSGSIERIYQAAVGIWLRQSLQDLRAWQLAMVAGESHGSIDICHGDMMHGFFAHPSDGDTA